MSERTQRTRQRRLAREKNSIYAASYLCLFYLTFKIFIVRLYIKNVTKTTQNKLMISRVTTPYLGVFFTLSNAKHGGKVLESFSRQGRLQRVLRQRLRNLWTQLKSPIVVFNQVEFQHVTVLPKITWGLVQRPKSAIFSFSACGWMDGWVDGWMDGCYRFFRPRFFPHRCTD